MNNLNLKCLIVDDDKMCCYVAETILKDYGPVEVATTGLEGISKFEQAFISRQYDLIILDIMMPEMDGQMVLKKIREIEQRHGVIPANKVKVIMVSAIDNKQTILESFQDGCAAYITKPIITGKLREVISDIFEVDQAAPQF